MLRELLLSDRDVRLSLVFGGIILGLSLVGRAILSAKFQRTNGLMSADMASALRAKVPGTLRREGKEKH
jgi:hypothetical protein